MASNPHTITLTAEDDSRDRKDAVADSTDITPGEAVEYTGTATGGATTEFTVDPQSTDGGADPFLIAIEQGFAGKGIDDDYVAADDEGVQYRAAEPGDEYYGFVDAGESVSVGDLLVFSGNGSLRAYDSGGGDTVGMVKAVAKEAVDNSGGGSPVRLHYEVV